MSELLGIFEMIISFLFIVIGLVLICTGIKIKELGICIGGAIPIIFSSIYILNHW